MARKYKINKTGRDVSLKEKAEDLENIRKITKETSTILYDTEDNPTKENIIKSIETVKSDSLIPADDKKDILKALEQQFIKIFNFDNCPKDYKELKTEVKFLSKLAKSTFIIMAHRLKKIRDNKLFKEDGYNTFKEFIEKELNLAKATVYQYIDIIDNFEVYVRRLPENLEYSKIRHYLPLLKSKNNDIPKKEIKEQIIEDIQNKSFREIQKEAKALKIKYGLIKDKIQINELINSIDNFIKKIENLPLPSTEKEKEKVNALIRFLKEILK